MESWCFDALDKSFVANEIITPSDSIIRSKNVFLGWEFKAPFNYDSSMLVPNQPPMENPGFTEVGIAEVIRKQFPPDTTNNVLQNDASVGDIMNSSLVPSLVTSNGALGDEDSSSKLSSSAVDSSSRESSLIDLKLGGFGDNRNPSSCRKVPSSAEYSTSAKRGRTAGLNSQTVYCQVYGCHKDLSSAKDYHRRHKVCDAHTKTSKVVVNGLEQRFCQQCSRFHLLGEFDDGKRSCRKRLAGHNERRRKPQVTFHSGRAGRTFSYSGSVNSEYQETLPSTSFICQDILHRGPCHVDKYEINGWSRHVEIEGGTETSQESANYFMNGVLQEKTFSSPFLSRKEHPSNDNNGRQILLEENVPQYGHEMVSHSLAQMNSFGTEDLTLFNAASTVQGLPGISESGCALSLLSSQSQNSTGHSSGVPGVHTSILPNNRPHYSISEVSEELFGVSSGLTSGIQSRYPAFGISSFGTNTETATSVPYEGANANSGFGNRDLQDSDSVTAKECLAYEGGTTVNLFQLSSQLHRVESQRQSAAGKQESEGFCCLRMT